jgi:hypothetical protein
MKNYLMQRSREPSTWRGLVLLLTAIGVPIAPHLVEPIVSVGLAVAGLIGVAAADR